ncbi:MAG: hypothetical protein FD135_5488, partial [Comamonadaceae bacterium]
SDEGVGESGMKRGNMMQSGGNAMRRLRGRQNHKQRQAAGQELDRRVARATNLLLLGAVVVVLVVGYLSWRGMR